MNIYCLDLHPRVRMLQGWMLGRSPLVEKESDRCNARYQETDCLVTQLNECKVCFKLEAYE